MGIVPKSGVEKSIGQGEVVLSNFINSQPELTQCAKCKGFIFQAHVFGWRTQVDATAIGIEEEIDARRQGRSIYQLCGQVRPYLAKRGMADIEANTGQPVFQSHDCKAPHIFQPIASSNPRPIPKEPTF